MQGQYVYFHRGYVMSVCVFLPIHYVYPVSASDRAANNSSLTAAAAAAVRLVQTAQNSIVALMTRVTISQAREKTVQATGIRTAVGKWLGSCWMSLECLLHAVMITDRARTVCALQTDRTVYCHLVRTFTPTLRSKATLSTQTAHATYVKRGTEEALA